MGRGVEAAFGREPFGCSASAATPAEFACLSGHPRLADAGVALEGGSKHTSTGCEPRLVTVGYTNGIGTTVRV